MITSLIDSVSQWSLGYSLFCHTGFWGPQYSNSFTDIQTLSLSLLFWFSSVHSKKTFNATHQIMLLSMRWDTKYVVTLPAISKTEMHSSAPVPTHPCAHAHTHTHTHTHTCTHNLLQPCHCCRHIWKCSFCMAVEPAITFCGMFLHMKTVTFQPILGSQVEPKAMSETWRIWWLEDGRYLIIH